MTDTYQQHFITISPKKYPGGLRLFECRQCDYAFAAEVDEHGVMQYQTKATINYGNLNAVHTFFQAPVEPPELKISAEFDQQADDTVWSVE